MVPKLWRSRAPGLSLHQGFPCSHQWWPPSVNPAYTQTAICLPVLCPVPTGRGIHRDFTALSITNTVWVWFPTLGMASVAKEGHLSSILLFKSKNILLKGGSVLAYSTYCFMYGAFRRFTTSQSPSKHGSLLFPFHSRGNRCKDLPKRRQQLQSGLEWKWP